MRAINYHALKREFDTYPKETLRYLAEAIESGQAKPEEFSLRELAEVTLGEAYVRSMDPRRVAGIVEEVSAVDSTAFADITGQLVISAVREKYEDEEFVLSKAVRTIPTRLDGEKIPGIGKIDGDVTEVPEATPYQTLGMGQDWITTPSTTKRGSLIAVTKEAIFFDRTNLILDRAGAIGEKLGLDKEIRIIDTMAGVTNNHNWRGTAYDTYSVDGSASLIGSGSPITGLTNALASNALADQTDVDKAEQLFADILDPDTSQPIVINPKHVLVTPAYGLAANQVIKGDEVRVLPSSGTVTMVHGNMYRDRYTIFVSRQWYRRIIAGTSLTGANAKSAWLLGDFEKAFAYMQNWPITVTQEPAGSPAEFEQDIVVRFKASERGVAAVMDPRYVVLNYITYA